MSDNSSSGDKVRLKGMSGAATMVVDNVKHEENGSIHVSCVWPVGDDIKRDVFSPGALERVPDKSGKRVIQPDHPVT